jgi:Ca-activated chloride channel family protein
MINIEFTPEKDGIVTGEENTFEVLLRASSNQKQPSGSTKKLPLNLALVLDRSGSMQGRPLEEAKKCAAMLVDRMSENDMLSVTTYDSRVDVIISTTKVVNKNLLKNKINQINSGGTTALYDGWSIGAEQVAEFADNNSLSRVLLLSDGQANHGLTDEETITSHCGTMAENGVTTSTYGLGPRFNENLMSAMATAGQGQSHYGQTADDLMDPFSEEFDLMEAIIARRMRLRVLPEVGVSFELLNHYPTDQEGRFILPDLAYGADVWALLKIKVEKNLCEAARGSSLRLLTSTIDFIDPDGNEVRTDPSVMTIELHSPDAYAELMVDETVQQRSIELRAATLHEQAHAAASGGDWVRVDQIMEELEQLGEGNAWLKASIRRMRDYSRTRRRDDFSKEARYKSDRMRRRSASRDEERDSHREASASAQPS